ncbi:MAG: hypothetical protein ABII02_02575 [Candidatus Magasanikbacteria bacterium]
MPDGFTLSDINHILAVKGCLILFLLCGLGIIWKKLKPIWFLLLTSTLAAASYAIFVDNLGLMFWGLAGDEITIAAMYESFAHGGFFTDFAYADFPAFYPPLFFWIFAIPGRMFDWNGIQMAKVGSLVSIFLFPLIVYGAQSLYWKYEKKKESIVSSPILWMLIPLIIWIFIDWDAMILKPYEVATGPFSVLWMYFLIRDFTRKTLSWKRVLAYGCSGGLIFMTYYLWMIFVGIAIALRGLWVSKKEVWFFYSRLMMVGGLVLFFSLPYLGPLVWTYHVNGSENWQFILMYAKSISYHAEMFSVISWRGFLMFVGFVSLIFFWKKEFIRTALLIFLATYVWQAMGFATIFFSATPIQESKGFYILGRTALACGLAYGLVWLWNFLENKKYTFNWQRPALTVALVFLSTHMIFGFFIDDPLVQIRRVQSRGSRETVAELVTFLQNDGMRGRQVRTLHAGISELHAYVPMNAYIYFNQHNSHPAALFSERYAFVHQLSRSSNAKEFYGLSTNAWFGSIDRYILFKKEDLDYYPLYFHLDNFPHGAKDVIMRVPKDLISNMYFETVFENGEFIVWDRRI